jgi:hypothetical protein
MAIRSGPPRPTTSTSTLRPSGAPSARQHVPPPRHPHEAGRSTRDVDSQGSLDRRPRHRRPQRRLTAAWMSLARIGSPRSTNTWVTAFSTQPGRRGRCRQTTTCRRGSPLVRTAASFLTRRANDPCRSWFDRTPISSIPQSSATVRDSARRQVPKGLSQGSDGSVLEAFRSTPPSFACAGRAARRPSPTAPLSGGTTGLTSPRTQKRRRDTSQSPTSRRRGGGREGHRPGPGQASQSARAACAGGFRHSSILTRPCRRKARPAGTKR